MCLLDRSKRWTKKAKSSPSIYMINRSLTRPRLSADRSKRYSTPTRLKISAEASAESARKRRRCRLETHQGFKPREAACFWKQRETQGETRQPKPHQRQLGPFSPRSPQEEQTGFYQEKAVLATQEGEGGGRRSGQLSVSSCKA